MINTDRIEYDDGVNEEEDYQNFGEKDIPLSFCGDINIHESHLWGYNGESNLYCPGWAV